MSGKKLAPSPFEVGDVVMEKWKVKPVNKFDYATRTSVTVKGERAKIDSKKFYSVVDLNQKVNPDKKGIRKWVMTVSSWETKKEEKHFASLDFWIKINPKRVEECRGIKSALDLGIL